MFPTVLDLSLLKAAVVGCGTAAARRVRLLDRGGAQDLRVFAATPNEEVEAAAGERLLRRWPGEAEIAALHILFTAGLADADASRIAAWARKYGTLVNTEDTGALCDFHVPAMMRRGDLLVTISTGGRSPGLARKLRCDLEARFGPEWGERLDELAEARGLWLRDGEGAPELARRTDAFIAAKGWLS